MKVNFYISSLSSGGAEHVLINIANTLSTKKYKVSIYSLEKRKQFYNPSKKVELKKIEKKPKNKLINFINDLKFIRNSIKNDKPDVTISFLSRCNFLLIISSFFSKNKLIVSDRNNIRREHSIFIYLITCFLYIFTDKIVVQTKGVKEIYPKFLQKKIVIIENPIDKKQLEKQLDTKIVRNKNSIISIGRLEKQKDFKTLIDSFKIVHESHPKWNLNIYGQGHMYDKIQDYINVSGLSENIALCGVTKKPFKEIKKSDIFILSSFYEGFPNALCEAMYSETCCISTNCKYGPNELITDNENGFLVEVANVNDMVNKINYCIENEEIRKKIGINAKISVERLSIESIIKKWENIIN